MHAKDPKLTAITYTKMHHTVNEIIKQFKSTTENERYHSFNCSSSPTCAEILAEFFTPKPLNGMPSTVGWPLSDDCLENYEPGKYMLTLGQLVQEPWK